MHTAIMLTFWNVCKACLMTVRATETCSYECCIWMLYFIRTLCVFMYQWWTDDVNQNYYVMLIPKYRFAFAFPYVMLLSVIQPFATKSLTSEKTKCKFVLRKSCNRISNLLQPGHKQQTSDTLPVPGSHTAHFSLSDLKSPPQCTRCHPNNAIPSKLRACLIRV